MRRPRCRCRAPPSSASAASARAHERRCSLQPGEHVAGVLVGREHRIEHLGDAAVVDDQRQPLDERQARDLHGRQAQRLRQRQLLVRQQRKRQVQARRPLRADRRGPAWRGRTRARRRPRSAPCAGRGRRRSAACSPGRRGSCPSRRRARACPARRCADRRTRRRGRRSCRATPACRRWRRARTSGTCMPCRCCAAPSSTGAGIFDQSTSSRLGLAGVGMRMRSLPGCSGLPAQMVSAGDAKAKALVERDCAACWRTRSAGRGEPAAAPRQPPPRWPRARRARSPAGARRAASPCTAPRRRSPSGDREPRADHRAAPAAGEERARRRQAGKDGRRDRPAVSLRPVR